MQEVRKLDYAAGVSRARRDDVHYLKIVGGCTCFLGGVLALSLLAMQSSVGAGGRLLWLVALMLSYAVLMILSGALMLVRRCRVFSIIVAATLCASIPVGTLLGGFTIAVLRRPGVRLMYHRGVDGSGAPSV